MEAMKAFHLDPRRWRELPVDDRARMIAHQIEASTRNLYRDALRAAARKAAETPLNPLEAQYARFGLA